MTRLGQDYFEALYAADPDPWGFEQRWYEQRKYALSVAALPDARYRRAFEPGCAQGVLSAQLAARCDALIAMDPVASVVARAQKRLAGLPHARVEQGQIPEDWPGGPFDLIVLSEIAYYFAGEDFVRLHDAVTATLEPNGILLAVHWRPPTDYPLSGDEAHCRLAAGPWDPAVHHEEESFVLDIWRRR